MSHRHDQGGDDPVREAAARWTVRRDRGLSAAESVEYELWLAADPRHAEAMRRAGDAWRRLDRLTEEVAEPALAAARRRRHGGRAVAIAASLAAAAAVVLVIRAAWPAKSAPARAGSAPIALLAAGPRFVTLADGTEVRLNAGSEIVEQFTVAERGVVLGRGEAHFTVTKDAARPFVVRAGALQVRALGTAFNVNLQSARTEVMVTEGRVAVATPGTADRKPEEEARPGEGGAREPAAEAAGSADLAGGASRLVAELAAGERAVVTAPVVPSGAVAPVVVVTRIDPAEMARALAWQDGLLRLGGATLAEIAAEFERRTGHRVILADPSLASLRLGGRFRADDPAGFAHLVAQMLAVDAERAADGTLVLRRKR